MTLMKLNSLLDLPMPFFLISLSLKCATNCWTFHEIDQSQDSSILNYLKLFKLNNNLTNSTGRLSVVRQTDAGIKSTARRLLATENLKSVIKKKNCFENFCMRPSSDLWHVVQVWIRISKVMSEEEVLLPTWFFFKHYIIDDTSALQACARFHVSILICFWYR